MDYLDAGEKQKIELFISCRSLKNMDILSKSDPVVIMYEKGSGDKWFEKGKTEMINDNLNPNFAKTFIMEYIFEKNQHLKFEVIDIDGPNDFDFIGDCTTTVGKIMGSKGQMQVLDLHDKANKKTGKIILRAEKVGDNKEIITLKMSAKNIPDIHWFRSTNPFLRIYRCRDDNFWLLVHETACFKGVLNPIFPSIPIPAQKLCNGNYQKPIKFEIWDYRSSGSHNYIGECTLSLHKLLEQEVRSYPFSNPKKKKECGTLIFETVVKEDFPEFIDYIRGGLELNLICAIDFTGSNGVPTSKDSLHYMSSTQKNQYQQAIQGVGEILINYDHDKQVPVYGFGGKPRLPHFCTAQTLHCFPLNGYPNTPEVYGLEGIQAVYSKILSCVELSGPTLFNPLISEALKTAQAFKDQGSNNYAILLIITDGEIHDMEPTVKSIVSASHLPISIIIIGVGNADFTNMNILDGDDGLFDSNGRKALRDLVQFVPFNKYKNDPVQLAQNVLEELPRQLEEYMKLIGRKPNPREVIDINNMSFRSMNSLGDDGKAFFRQNTGGVVGMPNPNQSFNGNMQSFNQGDSKFVPPMGFSQNNNMNNNPYQPSDGSNPQFSNLSLGFAQQLLSANGFNFNGALSNQNPGGQPQMGMGMATYDNPLYNFPATNPNSQPPNYNPPGYK